MSVNKHILDYVRERERVSPTDNDTAPYIKYVHEIRSVDLLQITEEQVRNIVEPFLIKWGWMARVLNDHRRAGWQEDLAAAIQSQSHFLNSVKTLDLSRDDPTSHRYEIEECYHSFRSIIAATSAAKVLHLVAPALFPPWDKAIRNLAWSCPRTLSELKKGQRRLSGGEYYFYMLQIQHLLHTYLGAWEQLAQEFYRTKVKIIDRYLWQNKAPLAWADLCHA